MGINSAEAAADIDAAQFRGVLSRYPTGVAVISAVSKQGEPLGMTVGSFSSVSLDPPLVSFMADVNSSSWASLKATDGRFCVNVLADSQEEECLTIARRKTDKFDGLDWAPGPTGLPVLNGSLATVECRTEAIHRAGDHDIVIGRVQALAPGTGRLPLLFFRGGYGSFRPRAVLASENMLPAHLAAVQALRPTLDQLAARSGARVSVTAIRGAELIVLATAGWADGDPGGWVGQRLPFVPPIGSVHAAWGAAEVREQWLRSATGAPGVPPRAELEAWLDGVRSRGYALALGHRAMDGFPEVVAKVNFGDTDGALRRLGEVIGESFMECYPIGPPADGAVEFRSATVPLVHPAGVLGLSVWGGPGLTSEVASALSTPKNVAKLARAIENSAYVVSANTAGLYGTGLPEMSGDGSSKVVDHRGLVLAEAGPGASMAANAEIDLGGLRHFRRRIGMENLLARQRFELYAPTYAGTRVHPANQVTGVPVRTDFRAAQERVVADLVERGVI